MIMIDIPLPNNCGECRLMVDGWCYALQADSVTNRYRVNFNKRPEWCPIKGTQCKSLSQQIDKLTQKLNNLTKELNNLTKELNNLTKELNNRKDDGR